MSNLTSYLVADLRIPPGKETDFHPNWYRDAYLGLKSALLILVLVLSLKVHRDFLKLLAFFLLLPIIVDISFDIYCEVHSNVDPQPRSSISWLWGLDYVSFFNENFGPQPLYAFYRINSRFYQFLVYVYTGYEVYRLTWWWSLASFGIGVFLFWSTLVYSMVALHLSHRAILRPHLLVEGPSPLRGYVNGLLLPTLFTIADVLIQFRVDAIPPLIYFIVISIERISLLLLALSLLLQLFASLFILCVREREYTKTCPYDEVSEARSRLVWLLVFVLLLNLLNVPAVVHASLSLAEDVRLLFSLGALPSGYRDVALFAFAYHGVAFFVRPAVILVLSLLFLVPYRRALVRSLCCQADY